MEKIEIKNLSVSVLKQEVQSFKKELFNLKLQRVTGQVKDVSQFKKLRIKIAQVLTLINQKETSKKQVS